jgi:predicted TIM-barrel fold metal-dependent hydrolase
MLVVDTHAHLFSPDEKRYPPRPNPSRPPEGTGTVEHLQREMTAAGARAVCAVQVSGFYGFDNRYICDVSKEHRDWIAGVVTLDPDDPGSPARLAGFVNAYGVRALRSVPAKNGKLDTPGVRELWKFALEHSVTVNLQVDYEHAEEADRLLAEYSDLPVVLDHALRLEAGRHVDETLAAVRKLAKRPNCHAKISSIANGEQGCPGGYPCASFQKPILDVIEAFGAERCCWGAHFPLERYSPTLTYQEHLRIYAEALPLSAEARRRILGETANRLYFRARLAA